MYNLIDSLKVTVVRGDMHSQCLCCYDCDAVASITAASDMCDRVRTGTCAQKRTSASLERVLLCQVQLHKLACHFCDHFGTTQINAITCDRKCTSTV
jgi:hypothetical protein